MNNPLLFTDPTGNLMHLSREQLYEEENRMNSGNGTGTGWWDPFAGYDPFTGKYDPYHSYAGFHSLFPEANMVGRFSRNPGPTGVLLDIKGNKYISYQNPVTGNSYYTDSDGALVYSEGGQNYVWKSEPFYGNRWVAITVNGKTRFRRDFGVSGYKYYFTFASNSGDPFSWVNSDSPLVEGSGSSLRGIGGELGFDVLGSRLMVGAHILTNEYKSAYNGTWIHTHEKYSGFNLAFGPFKLQLRYNWTNGYFENGFGLSLVNIQQNSRPTLSGISGTAYLFGGISGGINFDAGSLMQTATEVSNWYYENTGTPWMISFH
jgi:hypothetical protein